ncbi:acyl-CoA dehydrogenase family protein [Methylobacillus gramineus]|uniref:acyl-CoA dehydrogenase family protein n=1 Tax=Methylobacillus gramineus TaxID=755169 RepID=UPI001CFF9562|nr:acyl-CoA dehydrogenase family protein [Methylobacillus gramineus]MCB5184331.1 acyl-CoA dehydrogenase family protein [Methylobacillus gramineus]
MSEAGLLAQAHHQHDVLTPQAQASRLAAAFAKTAVQRDQAGGTPKAERDAIRASGLLSLLIPQSLGGLGQGWQPTLEIVREFARVDSSVAQVFGFQHLMLATVRLFGTESQWQPWFRQTAANNWFWGNALNPLDLRTTSKVHLGQREFHGNKSFCSGATDSDMLIASAIDAETGKLLIAAIPTARDGITLHDDWDNIGQRQTDSGSADFEHVRVEADELLTDPGPLSTPFACLRPLIAQLIFSNIYLGIAEGALAEARRYTLKQSRVWSGSLASEIQSEPYTLLHYGEFWVALEGARLLTNRAAELLDAAWNKAESLTLQERGEVAIAVTAAKVATTKAGLDITHRMFEVTGARATTAALRLDRFWRNLRVYTLHDPVDFKLKELGDWALNQQYPAPSFYS